MPAYSQTTINVIDIPDSTKIPEQLPVLIDGQSLAHALGIRFKTLMYLVIKREELYTRHSIPKKSGGRRVIHAPAPGLKYVQKKVLSTFFDKLTYPEQVAAYVPGLTPRATAEKHAGKPFVLVMDLKDFFTSTRRSWVRDALKKTFGYPFAVTALLSDLMTVPIDTPVGRRYVVPQGAPTSGAVCNWVAVHKLDGPILEVCKKWNMTYTRYADDLEFSCSTALTREQVVAFKEEVRTLINNSGYRLNKKKTRIARSGKQQRILGMCVNEKPNIIRFHYKQIRARIHHCKTEGFEKTAKAMGLPSGVRLAAQLDGLLSYYHMINPTKAAKLRTQLDEAKALFPNEVLLSM